MKEKLKKLFAPCQPELAELKTLYALNIFHDYINEMIPEYNKNGDYSGAIALLNLQKEILLIGREILKSE